MFTCWTFQGEMATRGTDQGCQENLTTSMDPVWGDMGRGRTEKSLEMPDRGNQTFSCPCTRGRPLLTRDQRPRGEEGYWRAGVWRPSLNNKNPERDSHSPMQTDPRPTEWSKIACPLPRLKQRPSARPAGSRRYHWVIHIPGIKW